ncbi:hypothetical protein JD969_12240 [Planctomycetota bacterium]|nr:hypothetical protein JD969_12240 [Planctomycetota bacterium]
MNFQYILQGQNAMFRITLAAIIIGVVLCFFGVKEVRLASVANTKPQTITAEDLINNGYGENAHITLTDFVVIGESSLFEYKEDNKDHYTRIWAPLVPINHPYNIALHDAGNDEEKIKAVKAPTNVDIVLLSKSIHTDNQFRNMAYAESVSGLIVNDVDSLGSDELKHLKRDLRDTDLSKVLILEHNRKPSGIGMIAGYLGGGGALTLVGLGMAFVSFKKR